MNYRQIAQGLADKLGSQSKAAKAVGVSQPSFRAWLHGGTISGENLISLQEAAVAHGIIEENGVRLIGGAAKSVVLRELDSKLGAGGAGEALIAQTRRGADFYEDAFREEDWGMPLSFLRAELKVDPKMALVAEVIGDSGYDPSNPTAPGSLFPGDRVIIDTQDRRPSPPGPFAVYDGDGLVIKLVHAVDGDPPKYRLSSRNPTYGYYDRTVEEAFLIGRVKGRISRL